MTGRLLTAGRVALSICLLGLGSRDVAAQGSYTSPFSIAIGPAIASWTSDFSARHAAIDANTTPPQADWYSPSTSYADRPYGPLNPQLYSSSSIGSPAAAASLKTGCSAARTTRSPGGSGICS